MKSVKVVSKEVENFVKTFEKPPTKKEFAEAAKKKYTNLSQFGLYTKIFDGKDARTQVIAMLKTNTTAAKFEPAREFFGLKDVNYFKINGNY